VRTRRHPHVPAAHACLPEAAAVPAGGEAAHAGPVCPPEGKPRAPARGKAARATPETTVVEIPLSLSWPCAVEKEIRER
jgi:hypothetical protein